MPTTKKTSFSDQTKASVGPSYEWTLVPYFGDAKPLGTARINDAEYAVYLLELDQCGNEVWLCSQHGGENHYEITLKPRCSVPTALACTCPGHTKAHRTCKHMVAISDLIASAKYDYHHGF